MKNSILAVPRFVALAALGWACSTPYEPQPQFWPSLRDGGSGQTGGSGGSQQPPDGSGGTSSSSGGSTGSGGSGDTGGTPDPGGDGGAPGTGGRAGGQSGGSSIADAGADIQEAAPIDYGPCALTVTTKTASAGGDYSPDNIGVIWIANGTGGFVKTLALWADERADNLEAWNSATQKAGQDGNTVDAVTGATASSHKTHTGKWDCTDFAKKMVPDGPYTVEFEMTDNNSAGPRKSVKFVKGTMPLTIMDDATNLKAITVTFTP